MNIEAGLYLNFKNDPRFSEWGYDDITIHDSFNHVLIITRDKNVGYDSFLKILKKDLDIHHTKMITVTNENATRHIYATNCYLENQNAPYIVVSPLKAYYVVFIKSEEDAVMLWLKIEKIT